MKDHTTFIHVDHVLHRFHCLLTAMRELPTYSRDTRNDTRRSHVLLFEMKNGVG